MDRNSQRLMMGSAQFQTSQVEFTAPGTYSVIVPAGITSLSVALCQSGQGGGSYKGGRGGDFRWKNAVPVTPGETLTAIVGALGVGNNSSSPSGGGLGAHAFLMRGATVLLASSTPIGAGVGGGNGGVGSAQLIVDGDGSAIDVVHGGSGGGAGGYSGDGGDAGHADVSQNGVYGKAEDGAGGAGAGGTARAGRAINDGLGHIQGFPGRPGGGTFLRGQGANGIGRVLDSNLPAGDGSDPGVGQAVGAGGLAGATRYNGSGIGEPGLFYLPGQNGRTGGVRLIWPGDTRQFPSTQTNDI